MTTLVLVSYAISFVHTVYYDHQLLVSHRNLLFDKNAALRRELEIRKHNIVRTDPVFDNVGALLMAFDIYRHSQNGKPCEIMLTSPRGENDQILSMVSELSNSVSDCSTVSLMNSDSDPDIEKPTMNGMVPTKIVFHAERDNKAANRLFDSLASLIQLQRSYDMPSAEDQKHYGVRNPSQEDLIWLQFGTNVQWNSQLR